MRDTYRINGRVVSNCDVKEKTPLCQALERIQVSASYNDSRMSKLNDEYKCSPNYKGRYFHEEDRDVPNCDLVVHHVFYRKFSDAKEKVEAVNNIVKDHEYSTQELQSALSRAKSSIKDVQFYSNAHKEEINLAFEIAKYDTNSMGVASALATLFVFPIGIAGVALNDSYNNEFDGKIERALGDIVSIQDSLDIVA